MNVRPPSAAADTPDRSPTLNVISLLERRAQEHPGRRALMWPDRTRGDGAHASMTYADLSRAAESIAAGLSERGLGQGDRVFLFVPMVAELYMTLFGVLRLGAVAVFLDSWARRKQLSGCAGQVEPRGFIGPEPAHAMLDGVAGFENVTVAVRVGPGSSGDVSLADLVARRASHRIAAVRRGDSALVTFTTGSSGVPKGADRTHGFLVAQHHALSDSVPYEVSDIDLPVFPVFSLNNLAAGITTVLPDLDLAAPDARDGERLLRQMHAAGATCSTLSPSLLRAVTAAADGAAPPPALRRVVTGGAPVTAQDADAFALAFPDAELHILYGSTEVEPIAHLVATDIPRDDSGGVCLGDPAPDLSLRFIRPVRDPVTLGEAGWSQWDVDPSAGGELLVHGPHVCPGYFRNSVAFARAKVIDAQGRAWHRTGDVCMLDDRGRLWFLGRVHNAILRSGRLLFPVRAEVIMSRLAGVDRAAYLGMPDAALGEAAWAVVTPARDVARGDVEAAVRSALERAGIVVDCVACVDSIPMDPRHHSKVDVDALRASLVAGGVA